MKTTLEQLNKQLNTCLTGRQKAAHELQNEVNQVLASALLWIRFAKTQNKLTEDTSVQNAEINVKEAIERVRALHYALMEDLD